MNITAAYYYLNASYHHVLVIFASDANTGVTLTVYVTSTGQKIGQLGGGAGGEFHADFVGTIDAFNGSNPSTITVKSSLGGTATSAFTGLP